MPSLWDMLMHRLVMSKVHNSIPSFKVNSLSILNKWVESLMKDWESGTKGPIKWSSNYDMLSVETPLPENVGLPGGFFGFLRIFGNR